MQCKNLLTFCITKSIIGDEVIIMKKMGRPKGDNNKEYSYTIRLDEGTLRRLEKYCELMGVMKSQAIRTAIENLEMKPDSDENITL